MYFLYNKNILVYGYALMYRFIGGKAFMIYQNVYLNYRYEIFMI